MTPLQEYQNWYGRTFIKLEIVKLLANKETALLDYKGEARETLLAAGFKKGAAIRNINTGFLNILEKNFQRFGFFENAYRLYYSLATFKQNTYPQFSFSPKIRSEEQKEFVRQFTANPADFMAGYDFALELDAQDFKKGYEQADKIKKIFDHYQLPYSLKPSGGKQGGFHFRIQYDHIKSFFTPTQTIFFTFVVNKELKDLENCESVDTSIFDARRIWKADYSLVYGANKAFNVCLPLSDEQFENFSLDTISPPSKVLETVKLKERGVLERKGNANGLKEFIDEYYTQAIESGEYKAAKDNRIMGTK